jgi:hypothetical protein
LSPKLFNFEINNDNSTLSLIHAYIFLISLALAWLSYKFIEIPFKRFEPQKYGTAKIYVMAVIGLMLVVGPNVLIESKAKDYSENIVRKAFERAMDSNDIDFGARAIQNRENDSVSNNPFGKVDRTWAQFGSTHVHGTVDSIERSVDLSASITYNCASNSKQPFNTIGEFGDVSSQKILLVLGDSYSKHWYPAIDIAARKIGYKVIAANSILSSGSLFELGNEFGDKWIYRTGAHISVARSNDRFRWIRDNLWPKADAIIIGISPGCFSQTDKNPQELSDAPLRLANTFQEIQKKTGIKPILIQSPPSISDWGKSGNHINKTNKKVNDVKKRMNLAYDSLAKVGALNTFHYMRVENIFLDKMGYAHTHIGGLPVYFDGAHINTLYSASAGEYFAAQLSNFLSGEANH